MKTSAIPDFTKWKKEYQPLLEDRKLIISISGGKDSTAMALLLKEAEFPFTCVHLDTQWDHPQTERYLFEYLKEYIGPITKITGKKGGMRDLIFEKKTFPSRVARFCTGELKLQPMKQYLRGLDEDIVNAVGIRAQESRKRAQNPEWEYSRDFECDIWRPILHFTEEDVIYMHKRHNVRPNPLYLLGNNRVGCWPCLFATKSAIRILALEDPERVDDIRQLEYEINTLRQKEDPNAKMVSWFSKNGEFFPIDTAIEWAFVDRTGAELFSASDREMGCMKWGLCEFQHPFDKQSKDLEKMKNKSSRNL